jgi:hypothetical protein
MLNIDKYGTAVRKHNFICSWSKQQYMTLINKKCFNENRKCHENKFCENKNREQKLNVYWMFILTLRWNRRKKLKSVKRKIWEKVKKNICRFTQFINEYTYDCTCNKTFNIT